MNSPGGTGVVNELTVPQNAMQHHDRYVVNFWRENKNSANWCAQQSEGIPSITDTLLLLTLYFLLKSSNFIVKKFFSTIYKIN